MLHVNEGSNLQKNYIATHYRNYKKLKDILKANNNNFTYVLNKFLEEIREFNDAIKNNKIFEPKKEFIEILKQFVKINDGDFVKGYKEF